MNLKACFKYFNTLWNNITCKKCVTWRKWLNVVQCGAPWCQVAPSGAKWSHIFCGSKWLIKILSHFASLGFSYVVPQYIRCHIASKQVMFFMTSFRKRRKLMELPNSFSKNISENYFLSIHREYLIFFKLHLQQIEYIWNGLILKWFPKQVSNVETVGLSTVRLRNRVFWKK